MSAVCPVILCGGSGTRLWPTSRPNHPKQFVDLLHGPSLFEQTVLRCVNLKNLDRLLVVAGLGQRQFVASQLDKLRVDADILLEPTGRDSAAAIAAAAEFIKKRNSEAMLVVLASDHYIPDIAQFQHDISEAALAAEGGSIVTLGIKPTSPNPDYGYIQPAKSNDTGRVTGVENFVEKPDSDTAAKYIADGYLWNSGNFIASAKTISGAIAANQPEITDCVVEALDTATWQGRMGTLGAIFSKCPAISFDHAVMEHIEYAQVLPTDLDWSDLGTWRSLYQISQKDEQENVIRGQVVLQRSCRNQVRSHTDQLVVLSNVSDLNVVIEDDAILISPLKTEPQLKEVIARLKADNLAQVQGRVVSFDFDENTCLLERWIFGSVLPLWSSLGFDFQSGLWRAAIHENFKPSEAPVRTRILGRQSYVFSKAAGIGWSGPSQFLVANADGGLESIINDFGFIPTLIDDDGQVMDDAVFVYDQTFQLLALAARYSNEVAGQDLLAKRARTLLDALVEHFGIDGESEFFGLAESESDNQYQSNPHMHLFEAALEWVEILPTGSQDYEIWFSLANSIAILASEKFIGNEKGAIGEYFTSEWLPAQGGAGQLIEAGHQFEWAWLLQRWSRHAQDERYVELAARLFKIGEMGIHPINDAVVLRMKPTGEFIDSTARLWGQTEWLKAALILSENAQPEMKAYYEDHVARAWRTLSKYLAYPDSGLWTDNLSTDGKMDEAPASASSLYHIFGVLLQMRATLNVRRGSGA